MAACTLYAGFGSGAVAASGIDAAEYRAKVAALGGFAGYLDPRSVPDSVALVPAPPATGSIAEKLDLDAALQAKDYRHTARWDLARSDAQLRGEVSVKSFACAAGVVISADRTPQTYRLLRRSLLDFGLATYAAKTKYHRNRPFMTNGGETCTPDEEHALRADGSYPSGHSAIGFGWSLVLAGLVPDRANAVVRRGLDFGDSRMICNVHWSSDVEQGRVVAAAVYARLQAETEFRKDYEAARNELAAAPSEAACAPAN